MLLQECLVVPRPALSLHVPRSVAGERLRVEDEPDRAPVPAGGDAADADVEVLAVCRVRVARVLVRGAGGGAGAGELEDLLGGAALALHLVGEGALALKIERYGEIVV